MFIRQVFQHGGTWVVAIKPVTWKFLGVNPGDNVTISLEGDAIVIRKLRIPARKIEKMVEKDTGETKDTEKAAFASFKKEAIDYLNLKTGKHYYYAGKATERFLRARFNEGRTIEDVKAVIDNRVKKWATDEKMVEYLRPITLFNASKFECYLAEAQGEQRHKDSEEQKEIKEEAERVKWLETREEPPDEDFLKQIHKDVEKLKERIKSGTTVNKEAKDERPVQ